MKITALIATAVVASSSVAMADSFSFQARATATASFRTAPYYAQSAPVVRDHTTTVYTSQVNRDRYGSFREQGPRIDHAPVMPAGVDCRNWDPFVEASSACNVFGTNERSFGQPAIAGWTTLGSRETSVPDIEYITVERSFSQLYVSPIQGRPALTGIGIKFMDGTWQTISLDASFNRGGGQLIQINGGRRHTISQIAFYDTAGSHGAVTAFAR